MTKTITVNVTQEDIDEGQERECESCPIALAVRRLLNCGVTVHEAICLFGAKHGVCALADEPFAFVKAFDAGLPVKPFSFIATFQDYEEIPKP